MESSNQKMLLSEREKDTLNYWQTLVAESNTKKLIEGWERLFRDNESRHVYFDDFLDSNLGMQIKVLREQRGLTQAALGNLAGMKQTRISVLESMTYSQWSLDVLRRLAKAFDLRLVVKFEDFGSYLKDYFEFDREHMQRRPFEKDVIFSKLERNKALLAAPPKKRNHSRKNTPPDQTPYFAFMGSPVAAISNQPVISSTVQSWRYEKGSAQAA